jgi:hypothetical protein
MVSCYAKWHLLPDSPLGDLNCLLNTCDCSVSVVGDEQLLPASINSLLAPLLFSHIPDLLLFLSQPSLLFHLTMGKDKKGQGSPRRSDDKQKREQSPSSEDFGDSEYSEEEFFSESEGSPVYASPRRRPTTRTTPSG